MLIPVSDGHEQQSPQPAIEVCPFTIIIDDREKEPYPFDNIPPLRGDTDNAKPTILAIRTIDQRIPTGDYTIVGMEDRITIERKSLADLFGSLGGGRQRFKDEFERMQDGSYEFAELMIEASLREVMRPQLHDPNWSSKMSPKAVYSTWLSWRLKFPKVVWTFAGSRRNAELTTFWGLERFWDGREEVEA